MSIVELIVCASCNGGPYDCWCCRGCGRYPYERCTCDVLGAQDHSVRAALGILTEHGITAGETYEKLLRQIGSAS